MQYLDSNIPAFSLMPVENSVNNDNKTIEPDNQRTSNLHEKICSNYASENSHVKLYEESRQVHYQERLDKAVQTMQTAIKRNPEDAKAYSLLGEVLKEKGELDEAEKASRTAIFLDPKMASAYGTLGAVYGQREQW